MPRIIICFFLLIALSFTVFAQTEQTAIPDETAAALAIEGNNSAHLWTLGVSAGSSFSAPLLILTGHCTIAPFPNSFLEIGVDIGSVSGDGNVNFLSLFPYMHYAYFMPFREKGGWYAGGGAGFFMAEYEFRKGPISENIFTMNLTGGVNLADSIDISYTFQTDFITVCNKLAVGWVKRFK